MGEVYQADDLRLGRRVAIKIVKPAFVASLPAAEAEAILQRFAKEARAAAAIRHAATTTVHSIGDEGGWPYIVMEWLEGPTLEAVLKARGRLTLDQVVGLGAQVLDFLATAHAAGVIHRDLKPANLMVVGGGRVKVTDFGVARVAGPSLFHTQVGVVMGTPHYASPEQLSGGSVDARTDLYALGCVLYEALVGHPPFTGASLPELLERVRQGRPVPVSTLVPDLDGRADAFFSSAIARDPGLRFPDARAMHRALLALRAPQRAVASRSAATPAAPGHAQSAPPAVTPPLATAAYRPSMPSPPPPGPAAAHLVPSMAGVPTSEARGASLAPVGAPPSAPTPPSAPAPAAAGASLMGASLPAQALTPAPQAFAEAATTQRPPMRIAQGTSVTALIAAAIRQWPGPPLGRRERSAVMRRLLERPLHAPAFSGALEASGTYVLFHDGILYGAFDPADGRRGDAVLDALPDELDATLHPVPEGIDGRLVPLLASTLGATAEHGPPVDASFASLPHLAEKLAREGFDGALRFSAGEGVGLVFFSRGRRVLDLFSRTFPALQPAVRWEAWIHQSGCAASVEALTIDYPSLTFRQQLEGIELDVLRGVTSDSGSIRVDTRAAARALRLVPAAGAALERRRGESTLQALLDGDPAREVLRWTLVELEAIFERFGRSRGWKAMLAPLSGIQKVRLHGRLEGMREPITFDGMTLGKDGEVRHVLDRVGHADPRTIDRFVDRAVAARTHLPALEAAILFAPSFSEAALERYLSRLKGGPSRSVLGALSHKEGYLRSPAGGFHVLLVEEAEGERRPLVFE